MHHVDARLKVSICRKILVVGGWGNVVSEAQTVVVVTEMHVDQTLVGTIKRDASISHGHHGIVIAHVGRQGHDTGVEEVGPSDIWSGREGMRYVE